MSNIKKRLLALLMTMVMALSLSVSAFAAEPVDVTQEPTAVASEEASTRQSLGDIIAMAATTITGGYGSMDVYLSKGNFWADLVGQIDTIDGNYLVSVSVVTPDGEYIDLGNLLGSNSRTNPCELAYASAGTYTFTFYSACPTPYHVAAFIYD